VSGTYASSVSVIKDKNGIVLKQPEDVKQRWKEYFATLYNDPNPTDITVLQDLPDSTDSTSTPGILIEEVHRASRHP